MYGTALVIHGGDMRRLLTNLLALAVIAMPSTSAVSLAKSTNRESSSLSAEPPSRVASVSLTTPKRVDRMAPESGGLVKIVPVLLQDANSKENRIFLLTDKGEVLGDDPSAVEDFFRCRRSGRSHRMAPEILSVLAEISSAYPGHVIEVVSGFRKRGFGVKGSKHFLGKAIDLRVQGVKTSEIRDFLWMGKEEARGVVDYRHEDFVHVDFRPNEAKVAWTQRRRNASYQFNPKWARL